MHNFILWGNIVPVFTWPELELYLLTLVFEILMKMMLLEIQCAEKCALLVQGY